jgi:hypothetical protein
MALCIGAATSLFTIVRSILLRPLPFRDPGRLVMVYEHHRGAMLVDGLRPALFGLGLGLVVSFAATRIFQSMLFGTRPLDPAVLAGVIATLLAVAILACLVPAWRASRLDPMKALRTK